MEGLLLESAFAMPDGGIAAAAAQANERDDGGNDEKKYAEDGEDESRDRWNAGGGDVDVNRCGGERIGELDTGVAVTKGEQHTDTDSETHH